MTADNISRASLQGLTMTAETICRASAVGRLWLLMAALSLAGFVSAAEARGITPRALTQKIAAMEPAVVKAVVKARALSPARQKLLVWRGADIDGDGQEDFVNPTGHFPRAHDGFGSGGFGASRDGGARDHEGVDYVAEAGQDVKAPISGFVTRIGYAYDDDSSLRYVEITNPAIGYVSRVFYVEPSVREGETVRMGQPIGEAASLQRRYAGITDHVHLELSGLGGSRLDATRLITAHYETQGAGSGRRVAAR